jgi:hypothetical protein
MKNDYLPPGSLFLYTNITAKTVHKKSRGRPAGVKYGETIPTRFEPGTIKAIDAWRRKQDDLPSRSEAIRRLVQLSLKAKQK